MPAEIINVVINRNRDGWYIARSDDLPGLFIAHPDVDAVVADVSNAIKALYRADFGDEVRVIEGSYRAGQAAGLPWIAIPSHLAETELR
jgi:hypothetical protein